MEKGLANLGVRSVGLFLMGIIFLVIGLVASFYQKTQFGGQTITPYMNVGLVLIVAGIIFVALGFLYSPTTTLPRPPSNPPPSSA
jgi:vacuolar-type H+-ATPase subunit I/STV1